LSAADAGKQVLLSGWVHRKRDHGGLLFADLRDNYGMTQCVFDLADSGLSEMERLRPESVIRVGGEVVKRAGDQVNAKIPTGEIEVKVRTFDVVAAASALPLQVFGDEDTAEDLRLKYRYIDLRRESLHRNILCRNRMIKFMRDRMWEMGFSEFQTPVLTASSPEGARDYLVPSRLHRGMFYALPQAPQKFKQLLQIAGFDRYFQIAPCFRDEDLRADRLIEFYQLDMEMSFAEAAEIQAIGNSLIPALIREFMPDAKLAPQIPHISHAESMLKYGSDKPDLRNPLEIRDVSEIFDGSDFGVFATAVKTGSAVRAVPAPNTVARPRSWFDKMGEFAAGLGLAGLGYIVFENGGAKGPVAKKLDAVRIGRIKEICGLADGDSVFFVCDKDLPAAKAAGKIRQKLGADLNLIDENEMRLCWIEDFPFYEFNEETERIDFGHNPFSLPKSDFSGDPLKILANQFDMVLNGAEICSGGLRNYNPGVMIKAFEIAGYSEEDVKAKFGGMWSAFQYGVPPHGGCAFGIDRIVQMILREPNLREVVAFPTNQKGQDLMLGAPREASEQQLRETHMKIR
jgi:aspartyl-tRNA synthetase